MATFRVWQLLGDIHGSGNARDPHDRAALVARVAASLQAARLDPGLSDGLVDEDAPAWLALGDQLMDVSADEALQAWRVAVTSAQARGQWVSQQTTPPELLPSVARAATNLRERRARLFKGAYAHVRDRFPDADFARVDHAVAMFLGVAPKEIEGADRRPLQFYFPGLPAKPVHDVRAFPWLDSFVRHWEDIRQEAVDALGRAVGFGNYFGDDRRARDSYLKSETGEADWSALFFYRHGTRFHEVHTANPLTSRALDSADLCRIPGQSPEVCFSVLKAGTRLLPHHGSSNVRAVFHLPLVVPPGCTLRVAGAPDHQWEAGQPFAFDDTFLHEAWNPSDSTRTILLMDVWNPYLQLFEREAVAAVLQVTASLAGGRR